MTQPLDYDCARVASLPRSYVQTAALFPNDVEKVRAAGHDMLALEGAGHDSRRPSPICYWFGPGSIE